MYTNFKTEDEAIEYLTADRHDECVVDLTNRFYAARYEGLDIQQATEKAQATHEYFSHNADRPTPEDFRYDTDEKLEAMLSAPASGNQEYAALAITIYRRYRSWGLSILFSAAKTLDRVEVEWYQVPEHNEKVEDILTLIAKVQDPMIRAIAESVFHTELAKGIPVHFAAAAAEQAANAAEETRALSQLFGIRSHDRLN